MAALDGFQHALVRLSGDAVDTAKQLTEASRSASRASAVAAATRPPDHAGMVIAMRMLAAAADRAAGEAYALALALASALEVLERVRPDDHGSTATMSVSAVGEEPAPAGPARNRPRKG